MQYRQAKCGSTREPDYHIGTDGRPVLTAAGNVKTVPLSTAPAKLNKCLHNWALRNGQNGSQVQIVRHGSPANGPRTGGKNESDIMMIKSSADNTKSNNTNRRALSMLGNNGSDRGGIRSSLRFPLAVASNISSIPRSTSSLECRRLVSERPVLMSRRHADRITEGSILPQQCRYSSVHKPLQNNRLSYQRKYDRSIFGHDRMDQFVLPPLQF